MAPRQRNKAGKLDGIGMSSDLEGFFGYNLKRAYVVVQDDFRAALGQDGLSPRVFSALSLAIANPNITQSELALLLGIERSGLVAIVDDLETRGYLKREAVPGDRRIQALMPTEAGRAKYAEASATVRAHEDQLFAEMTSEERQTLLALLKKVRGFGEKK